MSEREIKVLLVEDSLTDARLVQDMLAAAEGYMFHIHLATTLVDALDALAHYSFDIALIDLTLPDSQGLATFDAIRLHALGLPSVILTGINNEQMALAAMERGAQEYLIKGKLTAHALARVLQYSLARHQKGAQIGGDAAEPGKTVGVLSAKGGVGGTTIATLFSVELQRQTGGKTLLVDLDAVSASATFLMKAQSKYSLADAVDNLHRLDSAYWKNVVTATPHGVDLLQAPGAIAYGEPVKGERARHVLRFARVFYDGVVTDLGRYTPLASQLLPEIDEILVIATGRIPEMYETGRLLKKLQESGVSREKVRVVFNQVSRLEQGGIAGFESAFGFPVFWSIPDCSEDLFEAYGEGRFLDAGLALRKHVARMVSKYLGIEQPPSKSLLGRIGLAKV